MSGEGLLISHLCDDVLNLSGQGQAPGFSDTFQDAMEELANALDCLNVTAHLSLPADNPLAALRRPMADTDEC